ncbi:hypothetical protein [Taibaiella chishuiensis]|uniref:Uncharacterized protein n=1 Tax=Taibaiella chishuiensis TaxID=1434707 RepID=A0A2P8D5X6_9BACT|nr:hypothetical protein [Taibaiella chishuiensis]PSK92607.1 hypothetical protein B0I18_103184 [Taibaiella chishuiensis]
MKCFFLYNKTLLLCLCLPVSGLLSCSGNKTSGRAGITSNPDSLEGKQVYLNPADGNTYSTSGAFETYGPEGGTTPKYGPAVLQKIILLTDEPTMERVISIDTLDSYFDADSNTLAAVFKDYKQEGDLLIQFTLYAGKQPLIIVANNGNFDTAILRHLDNALQRNCSYYRTRMDSCTYQAFYRIGTQAPASAAGNKPLQSLH